MIFARHQRQSIDADFTRVFDTSSPVPSELNQITAELAEMDLAKGTLEKELESRLAYIASLKSQDYYLSIDTSNKTLALKSGNDTVREAKVQIGAPGAVNIPKKTASTVAGLKGAFTVVGKKVGLHGPAKYVIFLPNEHVISSPPAPGSLLKGPKQGSFMVSEADLQAIWDRITPETRVYIF